MKTGERRLLTGIVAALLACALGSAAHACHKDPEAIAWANGVETETCAVINDDVSFDGSASYDPDNPHPETDGITKWEWDFGDEKTDSGETTSHSYTRPGMYTVTLKVTDDDYTQSGGTEPNKTDTDTVTVYVICLEFETGEDVSKALDGWQGGEQIQNPDDPQGSWEPDYGSCYNSGSTSRVQFYANAWSKWTTKGSDWVGDHGGPDERTYLQPCSDFAYDIYLKGGSGSFYVEVEGYSTAQGLMSPDSNLVSGSAYGNVELDGSKREYSIARYRAWGEVRVSWWGPEPVFWSGTPSASQKIGKIEALAGYLDYGANPGRQEVDFMTTFEVYVIL